MTIGLEKSIYAKLYGTAGVTNYTSGRLYAMVAPQTAKLPHITFNSVGDTPHHAFCKDATIREGRVQISSWSTSYYQCKTLSGAVKTALRDFTGVLGTSGVTVQRMFYEGQMDMMEIDVETQAKVYHIPQDFTVWYTT